MKNYVVWTNCQILETAGQFGIESAGTPEVRASYQKMFEASVASARKNLRGKWEGIVFDDMATSRVDMFKRNWEKIHALWHSEPCNILYLDSDTLIVKPVEIFGRWPEFRMFNWTTPSRHEQFEHYFNAAVRYYPAHMSAETWKIGEDIAENWNLDIWDQEQVIFNKMFWSQGISWEDAHHPELNWQAESGRTVPEMAQHAPFNTLPIAHARIIHYHGTRGHNRGEYIAQQLSAAAGITPE
jgi:hypothetical protein